MAGDDEPIWFDERSLVVAGGVAGLILLAILVYAVMRTSDSAKVPATVSIPTSSVTPSTYTTASTTTTTSYTVPRVETSEYNPPPPPSPRPDQPTTQSR
ncbi:hypothetical protein H7J93_19985 [Mycobacterium barrassiae]|uniref:hypothetical protein n=1 Tax=Mycobacterium barrassiae TaxID=319709 RepID=UPI0022658AF6|nr:hypothetical protein [Mycobacterium barrassiae]MCV7301910.1 hypothetical protein [Mycobacterium barrassiae]